MGGGGPGRAHPRTRKRARRSFAPPRLRERPAPAPIPAAASPAAAAGPLPSPPPRSRGRSRGARAGRCCWRQGNPGEADPPPPRGCQHAAAPRPRAPPQPSPRPGEQSPSLTSPDASGCGDLGREALRAQTCPGGRSGRALFHSLGPGTLYRASEETEWPPGGNLGAQRVGAGIYVLAKNNSDPARLLLGPGAAPVGGGPPRRR